MIEKLKYMIDQCENNPKLKSIMLKIAELPEDKQEPMLNLIELMVNKNDIL